MKKLLVSAAAAAMLAATGAAHAADQDINVSATVDAFCSIAGTQGSATAVDLDLGTTTNGTVAGLAGGATSVTLGAIVCNAASNASLSSQNGALTSGLTPVANFDNSISYSATTTNLQAQATLAANTPGTAVDNTGTPVAQTNAFTSSTVAVSVTPTANTNPLLAGTYSDVITFAIVPQ